MTQSYFLTLKTLKTLELPWLPGFKQCSAGMYASVQYCFIIEILAACSCSEVQSLLCKCTVPPVCWDFFLVQFEQHNLPKYPNFTIIALCWSTFYVLIPCYTTELSCVSPMNSFLQSLYSASCFFSSLWSFPISQLIFQLRLCLRVLL